MESLAAMAANSIQELDVSFSPHITDKGLGYLVSKASHQFTKLHIWGCAQITEEFLDGHSRVNNNDDDTNTITTNSRFEIIGTWMKKGA
mmetsp:Transcript_16489/g.27932  ORF Transcript_16489/g.27932 Transcript_16489/m.27932 type:complete len:89 (+) Transcript_16489:486-752(+)